MAEKVTEWNAAWHMKSTCTPTVIILLQKRIRILEDNAHGLTTSKQSEDAVKIRHIVML